MNRRLISSALLLIVPVALAAMSASHALISAIGMSSGYRHAAVGPAAEAAGIVSLAVLVAIALRFVRAAQARYSQTADWALPALTAIRTLGLARLAGAMLLVQLAALVAGESIEQRLAGVAVNGMAGFVGSPFAVAPVIHIVIGIVAACALYLVARGACENTAAALALVRAALAWLSPEGTMPCAVRVTPTNVQPLRVLLPIADKIGSRPPPTSVRFA